MTTYIVLRLVADEAPGDGDGTYVTVGQVQARDDKHAIQQATTDAGTYVAVPTRSWTPRTRQVQTVVKDIWT